jgi:hypothetical protein
MRAVCSAIDDLAVRKTEVAMAMRILFALGFVMSGLMIGSEPASAKHIIRAWCLNVSEAWGGGHFSCDYNTYEQCMASRSANGEWCMQNPALGRQRY